MIILLFLGEDKLTLSKESKVWWTEDICEIRNAVYNSYSHAPEKRDRLLMLLDELYEIIQREDGYRFTFTRKSNVIPCLPRFLGIRKAVQPHL